MSNNLVDMDIEGRSILSSLSKAFHELFLACPHNVPLGMWPW